MPRTRARVASSSGDLTGDGGDDGTAATGDGAAAGAGDGGGASAETMQQTELIDLALDCGLATKNFPMTRIVQLFDDANKASGGGAVDYGEKLRRKRSMFSEYLRGRSTYLGR